MADRMNADELNKRLRAIENLRLAGVPEEREEQLKSESKVYKDQLALLNSVQTAFGGEASPVDYNTVKNSTGNMQTPIGAPGKVVEGKKQRYYELEGRGKENLTEAERNEMSEIAQWLAK